MPTKNRKEILLEKLKDLTEKIENNENLPHGPQDEELIIEISDSIDHCLTAWYY